MAAKSYWLTYDLGIDGDYDGLYAWLDQVGARECGDSACFFQFDAKQKKPDTAILAAIRKFAKLRTKDRLYLILKRDDKITGRFINGSRRRAPWAGFAVEASEDDDA
jgi:hypothetical protein